MHNDRFLRACRRQTVDRTPVWFMRQAGRYLPEYRAIRQRHSLLEICRNPELAVEVTLQPLRRFELDAAIIFADVLLPFEPLGVEFEFAKGEGPVIHTPIRDSRAVESLKPVQPEQSLGYVLEAIRGVRREINGRAALIGFAGGPFTLASYLIEGGSSRNYAHTKELMYRAPTTWHRLMEKLAVVVSDFLRAQIHAGAQAIQLFDSWVGAVGPDDYRQFVRPHSRFIFDSLADLDVPKIHFGTGTAGLLELMRDAGGDVIGVDWRIELDLAWRRLGDGVAIQGNLDPVALFAPADVLTRKVNNILERAGGRPGHVFNLGHGILPDTPLDSVERVLTTLECGGSPPPFRQLSVTQSKGGAKAPHSKAVLLMAYGGPDSLDEIEPYLLDVRGGRPTSPEFVQEIRERYARIGGRSPLLERTVEQAQALERALGDGLKTYVGMRHWHPYIAETLGGMQADGVTDMVAIAMAPQYSRMSVGAYRRKVEEALSGQASAMRVRYAQSWHDHPLFLEAVAERIREARPHAGEAVIFTAHSLPERILQEGDPYPDQFLASARAVAGNLGLKNWSCAYQSQGSTNEKWLGPDVHGTLDRLSAEGIRQVLVIPIGFVCDHIEVLYDIDVDYRDYAAARGMNLRRTESLNASPAFIRALAAIVRENLA